MTYRRILGVVLFAAAAAYTAAFVLVLVAAQLDEREAADVIVVLGAAQYNGRPSPVLRARLDHALELWGEGLAPAIVVTGGVGRGDKESEATVGRRYLLARQVPDSTLVVQPQGRSTQASMNAVAAWLGERGRRRAILVSDPFHMLRLRLEARRTGLVAYTSPTDSSPISDNPALELRFLAVEAFKIPIAYVKSLPWFR
ncbi:MAG: YdcF family protein [Gemmatimonadales bacterium]